MNELIKSISVIILLIVLPTLGADWYAQSGFLDKFMLEQSLSLMGTILAIYIASAASFLAILMGHEQKEGKKIFNTTTGELKQNICFITGIFFLHFLLLAISQPATDKNIIPFNETVILLFKFAKTFTFCIYIYAMYELNLVLFSIREKLGSK